MEPVSANELEEVSGGYSHHAPTLTVVPTLNLAVVPVVQLNIAVLTHGIAQSNGASVYV